MDDFVMMVRTVLIALLYVGLMNIIGGERHMYFNRIRRIISDIRDS